MFFVLAVLIASCSTAPSSSVTYTPDVIVTTMPTLQPVSSSTVGEANDSSFSALLARMHPGSFLLLGGVEDGKWVNPELTVSRLSDGEMYRTFYADGVTGNAKGSEPEYDQLCKGYRVETDSYPFGGQAVAVTGDWNAVPRVAENISSDNAVYVEIIRNWLVGQNFPEPVVEIDRILRVDMEGDGVDEVLISASHFVEPTGHNVQFGDYSLVLMRKVIGNSVVIIPIAYDYYYQDVENQFPIIYDSLFVADLNNDGVLEILVGTKRWEGTGVHVYDANKDGVKLIFNMFCGL